MLVIPQPFGGLVIPRSRGAVFEGGNQSHGSVLEFARYMGKRRGDGTPTAGGTLTINGESLGSYDYVIKEGDQTVSSFVNSQWFTPTEDSRSAWVVVKGNLTINSGQVFRPANRKLFTVVYVTGDLIVNGEISMSQRGANHSSTGSNIPAREIRIANGIFSGVMNPHVPAIGASGGPSAVRTSNGFTPGNDGANGTSGATGGGGSGGCRRMGGSTATSGAGSAGTAFSGGTGGGGIQVGSGSGTAQSGAENGGKGGDAATTGNNYGIGGGAGNPGGKGINLGSNTSAENGADGTGGVLIIIVEGNYSGSGAITAAGAKGGDGDATGTDQRCAGGGGSGGGSVTVMIGGADSGPVPTALGGAGGLAIAGGNFYNSYGGNGGNGTARKLSLAG